MGLLDTLFGGSKQSSSTGIDPNQLPYLQDLWGNAQNFYHQYSGQPQPQPQPQPSTNSYPGFNSPFGRSPYRLPGRVADQNGGLRSLFGNPESSFSITSHAPVNQPPASGNQPQDLVQGFTPNQVTGQNMALDYAGSLMPYINNTMNAYSDIIGNNPSSPMIPGAQNTMQGLLNPSGPSYSPNYSPSNYSSGFTPFSGQPNMTAPSYNPANPSAPTQFTPNLPTDTLNRMMSGEVNLDPYNKVADAAIGRLTERFNEDVLPNIRRSNRINQPFGSTREDVASGIASGKLLDTAGDIASNIYGDAYKLAQNQVGQGAGLALQGEGLGLESAGLGEQGREFNLDLGEQSRQFGAGLGEQGRQFNEGLGLDYSKLGEMSNQFGAGLGLDYDTLNETSKQYAGDLGLGYDTLNEGSRRFDTGTSLDAANSIFGNYNASNQNAINALGLSPELMGLGLLPSQIYQDVGGQQQEMGQRRIDAPFDLLSMYSSLLGNPVMQQTSSGRSSGGLGNLFNFTRYI